ALGFRADPGDPAVLERDGGVGDRAIARPLHCGGMAFLEQKIPHLRSRRGSGRAKFSAETPAVAREILVSDPFDPNLSENRRWLSVADLLGPFADAKIAILGVPLGEGSITPGRCDLGPATLRATLRRISTYDLETGTDLSGLRLFDAGDVTLGRVGLITFDAHFDLRDTDLGLNNGNPVQALLEDGLPGANIGQIGLAP